LLAEVDDLVISVQFAIFHESFGRRTEAVPPRREAQLTGGRVKFEGVSTATPMLQPSEQGRAASTRHRPNYTGLVALPERELLQAIEEGARN
jgi:hypothetical protein